jgi:hypothetical protein
MMAKNKATGRDIEDKMILKAKKGVQIAIQVCREPIERVQH